MPLPGTNYYALFCTWLAPEMPRPGCVWSHVLFIELADMAELPDLGVLRCLFRRPALPRIQEYNVSIEVHLESKALQALTITKAVDAEKTLAALYGAPRRPVVLTKRGPETRRRPWSLLYGPSSGRVCAEVFDSPPPPSQTGGEAGLRLICRCRRKQTDEPGSVGVTTCCLTALIRQTT